MVQLTNDNHYQLSTAGTDQGFFFGGGGGGGWFTKIFLFLLQNTSCIRKPTGHLRAGGGGGHTPLHTPPRSAPGLLDRLNRVAMFLVIKISKFFFDIHHFSQVLFTCFYKFSF